ncbi:MAG TPA: hypothetical protein VMI73_21675 [Trebonia sp.]|nr:hypothetical protein [Trebonia sp.]
MSSEFPDAPDGDGISTDPARLDAELIHQRLSRTLTEHLAAPGKMQEQAIAGSLNFRLWVRRNQALCPRFSAEHPFGTPQKCSPDNSAAGHKADISR